LKAKLFLLAASISLAPTASYARTWVVENIENATCDYLPSDGYTSPADAEDQLRQQNIIPNITEQTNADGTLSGVTLSYVSAGGTTLEMQFFTSMDGCQDQLGQDLKNGIVTDPNALR